MRKTKVVLTAFAVVLLISSTAKANSTGGLSLTKPETKKAKLVGGKLLPPDTAPVRVRNIILAANKITDKPYVWGGGHGTFKSRGYDCSGAVSFALRGGRFVKTPLDSSSFMNWGKSGRGRWFTVYTNPGHAFLVVAGFRFDTSGTGGKGPRWHRDMASTRGFRARSVSGY